MRFTIVFRMDGQWYLITHLNTFLQLTKEKTRSSKAGWKGAVGQKLPAQMGMRVLALRSLSSHRKPGQAGFKQHACRSGRLLGKGVAFLPPAGCGARAEPSRSSSGEADLCLLKSEGHCRALELVSFLEESGAGRRIGAVPTTGQGGWVAI